MSGPITFFRTVNDDGLLDRIGFSSTSLEPSYFKNGNEVPLRIANKQDSLLVSDDNRQWDVQNDGLNLKFDVKIADASLLFGPDGVASPDSVLGIAAICQSVVSDRSEAFPLCSFTVESSTVHSQQQINLSPGNYRSNLIVRVVLYLVECGKEQSIFPKMSGTLLGNLKTTVLRLFENSALFPIYETEAPGEPLWWVRSNWTDIENDPFVEENVAIVVNKSSKYYSQIDQNDKSFNPILLAEVISSSLCVIIEKVRCNGDDWNKILSDSTYPTGSIAFIVQYMYNTLGFDFASQESLAVSVRRYVYEKMRLI